MGNSQPKKFIVETKFVTGQVDQLARLLNENDIKYSYLYHNDDTEYGTVLNFCGKYNSIDKKKIKKLWFVNKMKVDHTQVIYGS